MRRTTGIVVVLAVVVAMVAGYAIGRMGGVSSLSSTGGMPTPTVDAFAYDPIPVASPSPVSAEPVFTGTAPATPDAGRATPVAVTAKSSPTPVRIVATPSPETKTSPLDTLKP